MMRRKSHRKNEGQDEEEDEEEEKEEEEAEDPRRVCQLSSPQLPRVTPKVIATR